MKEVRDISQIDYGNRITIKNPADEEFCLNIKKSLFPVHGCNYF